MFDGNILFRSFSRWFYVKRASRRVEIWNLRRTALSCSVVFWGVGRRSAKLFDGLEGWKLPYVIIGLMSLLAGRRAVALRRRALSPAAAPPFTLLYRPTFLAILAGVAITGGLFLLVVGVAALFLG
ncbi:hypothetical protein [Streptomyces sp. NPDC058398]|uniref:hypothetical protein n=1 Tax=Streptomyces sp. NPDC058398 TaxID=3346479 RepID=UPI0036611AEA